MNRMLNVIVYDNTETLSKRFRRIRTPECLRNTFHMLTGGLTLWWQLGAWLFRLFGLAHKSGGASNWKEAFELVVNAVNEEKVRTGKEVRAGIVQFWGHGWFGKACMGDSVLTKAPPNDSELKDSLDAFKNILAVGESSVWFRCCSAFHESVGKQFACAMRDFLGVKVIGHTYIIHVFQSGTHILSPNESPDWSDDEGGNKESTLCAPHTICALRFYPPRDW